MAGKIKRPSWQLTLRTPMLTVLALTTIVPLAYSLLMSLGGPDGQLTVGRPRGLGNYRSLLGSGSFWQSIWLVIVFLLGSLILELGLGVITALMMDRYMSRLSVARALLLWPAILPPVAVALIFKFILQGDVGMVSYYLGQLGYHQAWLSHPTSAMIVLIVIDVWEYTPFVILLALAALNGITEESYEAAALDGAGGMRLVRYVLLPMIRPTLVSVVLLRFIDAIQVFPTIYILTRGGPGSSTQLVTYYTFQLFFGELHFGLGSAMAVLVVIFTLLCVIAIRSWQQKAVEV